jgi:hypothetical protein
MRRGKNIESKTFYDTSRSPFLVFFSFPQFPHVTYIPTHFRYWNPIWVQFPKGWYPKLLKIIVFNFKVFSITIVPPSCKIFGVYTNMNSQYHKHNKAKWNLQIICSYNPMQNIQPKNKKINATQTRLILHQQLDMSFDDSK